jgi:hypothetical protein
MWELHHAPQQRPFKSPRYSSSLFSSVGHSGKPPESTSARAVRLLTLHCSSSARRQTPDIEGAIAANRLSKEGLAAIGYRMRNLQ